MLLSASLRIPRNYTQTEKLFHLKKKKKEIRNTKNSFMKGKQEMLEFDRIELSK